MWTGQATRGTTETTLVPTQPPWVNKIAHVKLCEPYLKTGVLAIGLTAKPKPLGKGYGNAVLHLISNQYILELKISGNKKLS